MSLAPGTRLGSYHVTGLLGEGGMGAVYRARDAKLNRDVALKVLLPEVASDPERLARFRREAQTLAALNHPHIGAIYGLEESNGTIALVLELVEGPTLADRIAQGPIPPDEALAIAKQIADALEAAHEQGIVHRDLKPANVKVRDDGTVKVLDFGLAKALGQGPGIGDQGTGHAAESLTITSPAMTMRGVILGTAAYMSPEQAKGKPVDKRADIWAFGVVLYEMCTGRRAFDGETLTDVIAAVVTREPDWAALSAAMPPRVRALLRRCLKKESRARLRDIGEARVLLDDLAAGTAEDIATATPARATWRTAAVVASTAIAVVAALGITVWRSAEPPPREVLRFSITPAVDASLAVETNHNDVAFSPDGERVAYFSVVGGARQLVVRPLDRFEPVVVDGVPETVRSVSFASDGLSLMFQAGQGSGAALFKVPVSGGTPSRLAPLSNNLRGATTLADSIVFATIARQSGLMQVPASGGEVETLTTPSAGDGELDHLWPSALPGGRHLLFSILRERTQFDVAILTLETRRWRVLIPNATSARYSSSGHIVFGDRGVLKAVPFDLQRLELNGDIVQVVDGVVTKPSGAVNYSISETGSLVYMPGRDRTPGQRLDWVRTADGQIEPTPLAPANFTTIRVSPDGRSAAAVVTLEDPNSTPFLGMGHELWLIDLQRGVTSSLVREPGGLSFPEWSPDGRRVAYYRHPPADATGSGGLFVIPTSGTEASVRATTAPAGVQHLPGSWTRDGQAILFTATDRVDASEIMQVSLATGTVSPVIAGATSAAAPALSPDGRWLAYREMPFARGQTFIRSFPRVGDLRIPVSADRFSGLSPISWAPDGGRLYYPRNLSPEQGSGPPEFRSVVVTAAAGSLSIGTPTDLLPQLLNTGLALPPIDGRLLRLRVAVDAPATEYRVILNWMEELKRLAPPK